MCWPISFGLLIAGLLVNSLELTEILVSASAMFAVAGGLCHIGNEISNAFGKKTEKTEKTEKDKKDNSIM